MENEHSAVYDGENRLVGNVTKENGTQNVLMETEEGTTYRIPMEKLTRHDTHWVLNDPVEHFPSVPSEQEMQARVDDMSADSFPASDPPSFTPEKPDIER